jgi:uncharacterized RDD family membrane protein YckC
MHDADILTDNEQGITIEPDSHIMFRRFVALTIDSIIIAFIISWLARTFGIAQIQIGTNITIPGVLFGPGGAFYNIPNASGSTINWSVQLNPVWQFLFVMLYFSLQEFFFDATIGKFFMRLRVISQHSDDTYTRLTLKAALLRNFIRFVDAGGTYILGFIFCICSSKRRRLGDMLATTLVVRQDSVPYITIPNKQVRHGAQAIILSCIIIAIGCPIYAYFWQPPITIQNNITIQELFPNEKITYYTLGEKAWSKDDAGNPTVTYPIQFVSLHQPENQSHACKGSVTLIWQWTMLSWRLSGTNYLTANQANNLTCTDHF